MNCSSKASNQFLPDMKKKCFFPSLKVIKSGFIIIIWSVENHGWIQNRLQQQTLGKMYLVICERHVVLWLGEGWWNLQQKCKSTPSKFDCCNIEKKNCHLQNERAYQIIICFDQYNITHLVQNLKMFLMLKVSLSTLTFLSRWNLKTYRKLAYSHRKSRKIISWLIDICACYY